MAGPSRSTQSTFAGRESATRVKNYDMSSKLIVRMTYFLGLHYFDGNMNRHAFVDLLVCRRAGVQTNVQTDGWAHERVLVG